MSTSETGPAVPGYTNLTRVGSGGFSTVFRGYQEAFDRTVAVKVLAVELVDETAQRRFKRECRASGRLSNHPFIVTVLDSGFTTDGRPFIATEFMGNGSLGDRLKSRGPFSLGEVLSIGVKMCSALAAVHAGGIIHRDIKPQNILVSDYGEPALADFGISAITVGADATTATSSLTPLHTAPEVLEGRPTSVATDIYALGSTLYMLLAGRAPFQGDDVEEALLPLLRRVVSDPVPDIERADIPPAVMEVLRYTLAKDPDGRYQTAEAFGSALQALEAHFGLQVTPMMATPTIDPVPEDDTDWSGDLRAGRTPGGTPATLTPATQTGSSSHPIAAMTPADSFPSLGAHSSAHSDDHSSLESQSLGGQSLPTVPVSTKGNRTPIMIGLAAFVVLLVVAGGLVAMQSRSDTPSTEPGSPTSTTDVPSTTSPIDGQSVTLASLRYDVDVYNLVETSPTAGGTLRVGIDSEPAGWNPAHQWFTFGALAAAATVYDPLMVVGDTGPVPYLAKEMRHNEKYDEWTIDLPDDVTFHDGTDLDAEALKANLDEQRLSELFGTWLEPVEEVETDGDRSVRVTMNQPWPAFPAILATQAGFVASLETLSGDGSTAIGTGPFVLESWERGKSIRVTKNDDYRIPERPFLDAIEFRLIGDSESQNEAVRSGSLDAIITTGPDSIDKMAESHQTLIVRQSFVAGVLFNTAAKPVDDVRVRQALSTAIDRDELNDTIFDSKAIPAGSLFPSPSPWADDEISSQYFDREWADTRMDEYAPSGGPVSITLLVGPSPRQAQVGNMLKAAWGEIGVDAQVDVVDPDSFFERLGGGTFQAALVTIDVPTDADEIYPWIHSREPSTSMLSWNFGRLDDSSVDKALETGRRSPDPQERDRAYAKLQESLVQQTPMAFLAYLPTALVTSEGVVGLSKQATGGIGRGGTPWATNIGLK